MMCIGGGTGILILVSLPSIITELVQISTATVAVAGIASIIGINIMGIVTGILGVDSFTHLISFTSEILGILMIGIAFGWAGIIIAIVVSIIVFIDASILWYEIQKSIESGQPTWITKGALGLLAFSYAFLIWFSFFGGWRVFAPAS
jgi:hypothetical protein